MRKYILIAIVCFTCFACEKEVLDKKPYYVTDLENLIIDPASAEKAIVGAYRGMNSVGFLDLEQFNAQLSGTVLNKHSGNIEEPITNALKFRPNDWGVENVWTACFALVNNSNWVLGEVPKIGDDKFTDKARKKQLLAEARFLRALGNSLCLTSFGYWFDLTSEYGIPLRNKLTTRYSGLDIARSTVKACYDSIFNDLDYAIANLRTYAQLKAATNYKKDPKVWACINTAKALKARMLMNRGLDTDLDEIISLTSDVISDKVNYVMQPDPTTVINGLASAESILFNYALRQGTFKRSAYKIDDMGNYWWYVGTLLDVFIKDPKFAGQTDLRVTTDKWGQDLGYYNVPVGKERIIIKYANDNLYMDQDQLYFIRLSEIYLLKAEAHAKKDELDLAKESLSAIWKQAGGIEPVPLDISTKEKVLKLILRENYVELAIEFGQEWYFLVRNGMVRDYRPASRITGREFYVLPIPYNEMINNDLIKQNPGYETN
ncbi:MAG: RagB/SusD family nutrient uptake outer membrane protein [Bacteroidales bacterium]|nr:MAG: RagB/SusD family nutrient uptake outer membrane protein [Bacteroidales bacterium]